MEERWSILYRYLKLITTMINICLKYLRYRVKGFALYIF